MRCDFCSYEGPSTKWSVFTSSNMVEFRPLCGPCRAANSSPWGWNVVEHHHGDTGRLHSACHACDLAEDLTTSAGQGDQPTKAHMDLFAYAGYCLNGCHDRDYGSDESIPTTCTCTAEETLAAVAQLNAQGFDVVFTAVTL
jgi:hypothetical protein